MAIELHDCQLKAPGRRTYVRAECGTYRVWEDRRAESGRHIDLQVAIVPALSREPRPDPLVFLTAGPGQAATESFVVLKGAFREIHRERDILLVDQRGTGGSNALRCPPPAEATDFSLLSNEKLENWVTTCLDQLDADPRHYLTAIAMEDLDDVREALGYERVNLYGVSYGTRAALSYLRRFPDRVRTVILDGVVPPGETLGIDVARDAQRALELIVARCEEDPDCSGNFAGLGAELERVMERLRTPVPVELLHPRTGELETIELNRDAAAVAVRLLSYSKPSM